MDHNIGVFFLDCLGDLVHEPDYAAGMRPLLRVDGSALLAFAVVVPVLLRYAVMGNGTALWIGLVDLDA